MHWQSWDHKKGKKKKNLENGVNEGDHLVVAEKTFQDRQTVELFKHCVAFKIERLANKLINA